MNMKDIFNLFLKKGVIINVNEDIDSQTEDYLLDKKRRIQKDEVLFKFFLANDYNIKLTDDEFRKLADSLHPAIIAYNVNKILDGESLYVDTSIDHNLDKSISKNDDELDLDESQKKFDDGSIDLNDVSKEVAMNVLNVKQQVSLDNEKLFMDTHPINVCLEDEKITSSTSNIEDVVDLVDADFSLDSNEKHYTLSDEFMNDELVDLLEDDFVTVAVDVPEVVEEFFGRPISKSNIISFPKNDFNIEGKISEKEFNCDNVYIDNFQQSTLLGAIKSVYNNDSLEIIPVSNDFIKPIFLTGCHVVGYINVPSLNGLEKKLSINDDYVVAMYGMDDDSSKKQKISEIISLKNKLGTDCILKKFNSEGSFYAYIVPNVSKRK